MKQKYRFPEDRYILIGTVAKPQGLDGEVSIFPLSDQPENFLEYQEMVLVGKDGTLSPDLQVQKIRIQKGRVIVKFDRVTDRSFAEKLNGMGVLLARENLPDIDEEEYYWHEITGKEVVTVDERYLGTVDSLFSNGAQDIMVITDGDNEYLVPITDSVVRTVGSDRIVIDPPQGLLDINNEDE